MVTASSPGAPRPVVSDTNVVSELMRAAPDEHVKDWVREVSPAMVYTTSVTLACPSPASMPRSRPSADPIVQPWRLATSTTSVGWAWISSTPGSCTPGLWPVSGVRGAGPRAGPRQRPTGSEPSRAQEALRSAQLAGNSGWQAERHTATDRHAPDRKTSLPAIAEPEDRPTQTPGREIASTEHRHLPSKATPKGPIRLADGTRQ